MEWLSCIKSAIDYMENNLLTVKSPEDVAGYLNVSTLYLQKGFQIITGYNIGEYIRNRRLYLAAVQLAESREKIIDVALEYGYETPESFTKAFTRFHGATPSEIRKDRTRIKTFLPLRVHIIVQGGYDMDFVVEKMAAFQVIGFSREFLFDTSYAEIPKFWDEMSEKYGKNLLVGNAPANELEQAVYDNRIGEFGICIDDIGKDGKFRYMIAGRYVGGNVPEGMKLYEIPATLWAKFKCVGALPTAMQTVNTQIWNEWLPGNSEYELDGKFNVEWYSNSGDMQSADYQSAVWMPIKSKE